MAPRSFKAQVQADRRRRGLAALRRRLWTGRWHLVKTAIVVTAAYLIAKWISA